MPNWRQSTKKYKGRVVLRGDIVKDDSGSDAVFTEQGSSASQMTAVKVMDVISRLPGCSGQAADAVSAYTQLKMEDAPKWLKIPKSVNRTPSHVTFSLQCRTWHWLKVSFARHPCVIRMLLSWYSSTLYSALFTVSLIFFFHSPDLHLHLPCGSVRREVPCTLQVVSPTSSTITTSQRPLKSSSRSLPATPGPRSCMTRRSVTTPSAERCLHHCSLRSEKIQRAVDKLITLLKKVCCQVSRCLSVMWERWDL